MAAVCSRCQKHLRLAPKTDGANGEEQKGSCSVCLGIFDSANLASQIQTAVSKALHPYGGSQENRISRKVSPPSVSLPGDLAFRYQHLAKKASAPLSVFCQDLKQHVKTTVNRVLDQSLSEKSKPSSFPIELQEEELGFMALHLVLVPSQQVYRPEREIPIPKTSKEGRKKKYNDGSTQGGDPRLNLELRLQRQGTMIWPLNQSMNTRYSFTDDEAKRLIELPHERIVDIHTTVWRRPFYIKGCYTKTKRDISQTPFHVTDSGKRRKIGRTSVEEEIAPAIVSACQGISTLNNDETLAATIFGMAKFHASGREDMDVRMLLPDPPLPNVTGRPFVFEIYDALRLPSLDALTTISRQVNAFDDTNNVAESRSYGRNPNGVGISSNLQFVPSSDYKTLQADTETKVKHYGCLCWSATPHQTLQELTVKIGSYPQDISQQTPIRVLHRRANSLRPKQILQCKVTEYIDAHYFRLHLRTSAGTYVKEFVHGDLGRTVPSISSLLGCTTDILELDCEGIQMS